MYETSGRKERGMRAVLRKRRLLMIKDLILDRRYDSTGERRTREDS